MISRIIFALLLGSSMTAIAADIEGACFMQAAAAVMTFREENRPTDYISNIYVSSRLLKASEQGEVYGFDVVDRTASVDPLGYSLVIETLRESENSCSVVSIRKVN